MLPTLNPKPLTLNPTYRYNVKKPKPVAPAPYPRTAGRAPYTLAGLSNAYAFHSDSQQHYDPPLPTSLRGVKVVWRSSLLPHSQARMQRSGVLASRLRWVDLKTAVVLRDQRCTRDSYESTRVARGSS